MDVIAHKTPGPNAQPVLACILPQQLQVDLMILLVIEDCLAAVAALRYVVRHSLRDYPSDSWHLENGVRAIAKSSP